MLYEHEIAKAHNQAMRSVSMQLDGFGNEAIPVFLRGLMMAREGKVGSVDIREDLRKFERGPMARMNAVAKAIRQDPRGLKYFPKQSEIVKANPELAKAELDVGTLTNFSQITGGQTLGYVSLDTQLARGTIRPGSFTLYQCLKKSAAFQVVDYWGYASELGTSIPGTAFASYQSVGTGSLVTDAGMYDLKYITLKLALNGRAITTALAAQNSYVNVVEQENTNAALSVLQTVDWACYWGNPDLYPNQFQGLWQQLPDENKIDFQTWYYNTAIAKGWSNEQALFNLIYAQAATITNYRQFGIITHAFMSPYTAQSMQTLVTGLLNNLVNFTGGTHNAMVVNGDLRGMDTAFGSIHFPIDLIITSRDMPAQAIVFDNGTTPATSSNPTPPASVTVAASGAAATGSMWAAPYTGSCRYAVASCDANMNESTLVWASASSVTVSGAYVVTITGPSAADAAVFRVYRSGVGGTGSSPTSVRFVGEVAANGSSAVTFVDLNTHIPGSETIFLLDMEEGDNAIDYRYLLPLSRVNLFAQSLYMPWCVAAIGGLRVRIPKFHGAISNYVPSDPVFNPLTPNS